MLDLDYSEDSRAEVDLNVVIADGRLLEIGARRRGTVQPSTAGCSAESCGTRCSGADAVPEGRLPTDTSLQYRYMGGHRTFVTSTHLRKPRSAAVVSAVMPRRLHLQRHSRNGSILLDVIRDLDEPARSWWSATRQSSSWRPGRAGLSDPARRRSAVAGLRVRGGNHRGPAPGEQSGVIPADGPPIRPLLSAIAPGWRWSRLPRPPFVAIESTQPLDCACCRACPAGFCRPKR